MGPKVWGLGVPGLVYRVWGLGSRGLRLSGLGSRVAGWICSKVWCLGVYTLFRFICPFDIFIIPLLGVVGVASGDGEQALAFFPPKICF